MNTTTTRITTRRFFSLLNNLHAALVDRPSHQAGLPQHTMSTLRHIILSRHLLRQIRLVTVNRTFGHNRLNTVTRRHRHRTNIRSFTVRRRHTDTALTIIATLLNTSRVRLFTRRVRRHNPKWGLRFAHLTVRLRTRQVANGRQQLDIKGSYTRGRLAN